MVIYPSNLNAEQLKQLEISEPAKFCLDNQLAWDCSHEFDGEWRYPHEKEE